MGVQLMKSEATFSLHLDGSNTIDAVILSDIIRDIAELTKLAANEKDTESYLKMNVTAFENGSFQIDFSAIKEFVDNLINNSSQVLTFAGQVVATVKGYFEVKKLLKGKKEKNIAENQDGSVTITSQEGGSVIVNKGSTSILNNARIDNLVVNVAESVYSHNPNGGFSFNTDSTAAVFSTEDIIEMRKPLPIIEEEIIKRSVIKADLLIIKPDLLRQSAWTFFYQGKTISASIVDVSFLEELHKGNLAIHGNDYITTDLEISVRMEHGLPVTSSTRYAVIKVYDGIKSNYDAQINLLE